MPLTRFPNGLTVNSTTALQYNSNAGNGDIDCNRLFVAGTTSIAGTLITTGNSTVSGTLTVGTLAMGVQGSAGVGFIGQRAYVNGSFTSAATTQFLAVPFAGNIVDAVVVADTTPRVCSAFTVLNGSAGSVAVASVALTYATAIGQQVRPTLTPVAVTTASGIGIVVTTAGSACTFTYTLVIEKTA